jgi:N-acetylglucosaminyldiphosphoundecaprenol N-acetyl-beta-D-mannosaminyltransferase
MPNRPENNLVIERINQFDTQILVLGFGMPMQERWILENLAVLQVKIAFPAGALFDYVSGELPRAPRWMTDNGFEWLGRLLIEPRRLWKRYILGNPLFFYRLFLHHVVGIALPK